MNICGMYIGINNFRKRVQVRMEMVKNENDNLITNSKAILKNYFKWLLNVDFENNREIGSFVFHIWMINEPMTLEVKSAIKRLKNHKTSGIDCEACHYDTRQEKNLEYSKIRYFEKLSGQKAIKKLVNEGTYIM